MPGEYIFCLPSPPKGFPVPSKEEGPFNKSAVPCTCICHCRVYLRDKFVVLTDSEFDVVCRGRTGGDHIHLWDVHFPSLYHRCQYSNWQGGAPFGSWLWECSGSLCGRSRLTSFRMNSLLLVIVRIMWLHSRASSVTGSLANHWDLFQMLWFFWVSHCRGFCVHTKDHRDAFCGPCTCMGGDCNPTTVDSPQKLITLTEGNETVIMPADKFILYLLQMILEKR